MILSVFRAKKKKVENHCVSCLCLRIIKMVRLKFMSFKNNIVMRATGKVIIYLVTVNIILLRFDSHLCCIYVFALNIC